MKKISLFLFNIVMNLTLPIWGMELSNEQIATNLEQKIWKSNKLNEYKNAVKNYGEFTESHGLPTLLIPSFYKVQQRQREGNYITEESSI